MMQYPALMSRLGLRSRPRPTCAGQPLFRWNGMGAGMCHARASGRTRLEHGEMPTQRGTSERTREQDAVAMPKDSTSARFHGVRYQVQDVGRSIAFYSEYLGFRVEHQQLPAFATLVLGPLNLLLSGPDASGSRPMPDGRRQEPGGWNRVVLRVSDLPAWIQKLKKADVHFRNEMETGPAGRQIQLEDPDRNPIELFEPAR